MSSQVYFPLSRFAACTAGHPCPPCSAGHAFISPVLSPILLVPCVRLFILSVFRSFSLLVVIVSVLSPFCLLLSPVLSSFLLGTVSILSPFCFFLSPFLSPLLSPFLLVIVSALSPFFPLHVSCASSVPLSLATLHICLPAALPCNPLHCLCLHLSPALGCCVRLALQSFTFVSQLWAAVSASALQSFTFVSQRWAAVSASALQSFTCVLASLCICLPALDCCVRLCLAILYMCPRKPLHLSPSSRLLYPPLPCNPLFVTQLWAACRLQSFTFVSLCLHLSPSSGLLWPPLPCNPLSPSSGRRKL